jgi:hypothetical protein
MGADPHLSIVLGGLPLPPLPPSTASIYIANVRDDLAVDTSRVICSGCANVHVYNWEEITDNTGFDLKLWPYPDHTKWNCNNEFSCAKRGGTWVEDCWDHRNVNTYFRPKSFPTYITHHEVVTYDLDDSCRNAIRACQYRIDKDWSVHFISCTPLDGSKVFSNSCGNPWNGCS